MEKNRKLYLVSTERKDYYVLATNETNASETVTLSREEWQYLNEPVLSIRRLAEEDQYGKPKVFLEGK